MKLGLQALGITGKLSARGRSEYFAQEKSLKVAAAIFSGEIVDCRKLCGLKFFVWQKFHKSRSSGRNRCVNHHKSNVCDYIGPDDHFEISTAWFGWAVWVLEPLEVSHISGSDSQHPQNPIEWLFGRCWEPEPDIWPTSRGPSTQTTQPNQVVYTSKWPPGHN